MEVKRGYDHEQAFSAAEDWITALARQLFRASRASDSDAVEVTLFYLEEFLQRVLASHLRVNGDWLDYPSPAYRWFDGLRQTDVEYIAPHKLRIRSTIAWVIDNTGHCYDPFEFELETCPRTGAFRHYVFRFGDDQPIETKSDRIAKFPQERWVHEFQRSRRDGMPKSEEGR